MQFVVIAAAEGAKAAVIINKELQKEISKNRLKANKEHLIKAAEVHEAVEA